MSHPPHLSLHRLPLLATLAAVLSLLSATLTAATLVGNISNLATGNLLEGARVAVLTLGLSALSDLTGQYTLGPLPPGTHEVVVSYTGLDTVRTQLVITDAPITTRHFDLTADIYKLDAFKVVGEREGGAAAITSQRNADNVKNVVATDSFGNLPNLNAAEVAIRLTGVAGNPDDGGTYTCRRIPPPARAETSSASSA